MTYHREQDIGKPRKDSITVDNLDTLIEKVKDVTQELQEAVEELKKISLGTGLVTGVDLDEEEV